MAEGNGENGKDVEAQQPTSGKVEEPSTSDTGDKALSKNKSQAKSGMKSTKSGKEGEGGNQASGAYDVTEHLMSTDEVAQQLGTGVNHEHPEKSKGLTEEEARLRTLHAQPACVAQNLSKVCQAFKSQSTLRHVCATSACAAVLAAPCCANNSKACALHATRMHAMGVSAAPTLLMHAAAICTSAHAPHAPNCRSCATPTNCLQAKQRLETDGENKLSPPPDKPEWLKYLLQFTNPLLMILIVAAVLSFVAYGIQTPKDISNVILGAVLLFMIFLLATTQYLNNRAASGVAKQLSSMLPQVRCACVSCALQSWTHSTAHCSAPHSNLATLCWPPVICADGCTQPSLHAQTACTHAICQPGALHARSATCHMLLRRPGCRRAGRKRHPQWQGAQHQGARAREGRLCAPQQRHTRVRRHQGHMQQGYEARLFLDHWCALLSL